MTTNTAEMAAVSMALAERLRHRCPECGGWEYPLRLKCPIAANEVSRPVGQHLPCCSCSGRGWLPAEPDLALWMAAAAKCGVDLHLMFEGGWYGMKIEDGWPARHGPAVWPDKPTDRASILLAAGRALVEMLA